MKPMKRLTFLLSGEHDTLPAAEAAGAVEAEGFHFEEVEKLDQVLILETEARPHDLARRLGMSHWIGEHMCTARPENLMEAIGSSDMIDFLPQSETVAIRTKRIKNYHEEIDSRALTEKIADEFLKNYDYEIDLENPENEISVILTGENCVVSIVKAKVERSKLGDRKPPKRAKVHPSTMQPEMARTMVNLARTPRDGVFLDPFCGVGGILLEAGLLGTRTVGIDIDPKLVKGSEKNLEEAGLKEYSLKHGDARDLDFKEEFDAIATDPPYGRQASTGGLDLDKLYDETMPEMAKALKPGRFLTITAPAEIDLERFSNELPIELKEKHGQRVHKNLERKIYVFRREEN